MQNAIRRDENSVDIDLDIIKFYSFAYYQQLHQPLQFLISQSNTTSESIPCIMKASIISFFALASSLVGVLAAPAAAPVAELEVRKNNDVAQAQAIVNDLSTTLQPMLAAISTCPIH